MLKIRLKYRWSLVTLNIATWLLWLANRVDGRMVEEFAFQYTHSCWSKYEDWCWNHMRNYDG